MAESDPKVYLEKIVQRVDLNREELMRKEAVTPVWHDQAWPKFLSIRDLYGPTSRARFLKKPDIHRITCRWTAKECVDLLERILNVEYVPDVILWLGPDDSLYVADGVHRLSVVVGWVKDDWGDNLPSEAYSDKTQETESKLAGEHVRELLQQRNIGSFGDCLDAYTQYKELEKQLGYKPTPAEMDPASLRYGERFLEWELKEVGLPLMWLKGNYAQAEASVLSYQAEFARLRELHNDVFDTPEFQAAHDKLMEKLGSHPKPNVSE